MLGHPVSPRQTQSLGLIGSAKSARAPRGSKANTVSRAYSGIAKSAQAPLGSKAKYSLKGLFREC